MRQRLSIANPAGVRGFVLFFLRLDRTPEAWCGTLLPTTLLRAPENRAQPGRQATGPDAWSRICTVLDVAMGCGRSSHGSRQGCAVERGFQIWKLLSEKQRTIPWNAAQLARRCFRSLSSAAASGTRGGAGRRRSGRGVHSDQYAPRRQWMFVHESEERITYTRAYTARLQDLTLSSSAWPSLIHRQGNLAEWPKFR